MYCLPWHSLLHCSSMSKLGTWGDHITLQAAADAFLVAINVITSFLENSVITITPTVDDKRPPDPQVSIASTLTLLQMVQPNHSCVRGCLIPSSLGRVHDSPRVAPVVPLSVRFLHSIAAR